MNLLWFKASTILGYLIWRFNATTNSGGYPVRSFTAEYRNVSPIENQTYPWSRLDPINISPNIVSMKKNIEAVFLVAGGLFFGRY